MFSALLQANVSFCVLLILPFTNSFKSIRTWFIYCSHDVVTCPLRGELKQLTPLWNYQNDLFITVLHQLHILTFIHNKKWIIHPQPASLTKVEKKKILFILYNLQQCPADKILVYSLQIILLTQSWILWPWWRRYWETRTRVKEWSSKKSAV